MKRNLKNNLLKQLISLAFIIALIILITLVFWLPRTLLPIYEKNLYQYLKQPLELLDDDNLSTLKNDIAYIYITNNNEVITSLNLKNVIKLDTKDILKYIDKDYGKFTYARVNYYYYTSYTNHILKISITNSNYINEMRNDLLPSILTIVALTLVIISAIIILWSHNLIAKIEHLKDKIDNLNNDDYVDNYDYKVDDELKVLSQAIDDMKKNLQAQDEYKNQMYQNISHDFKTPLTVIKSYTEAILDGVEDEKEGLNVIAEQVKNLELKVHSLLYLNKLNYFENNETYQNEIIDVRKIILKEVEKFKLQRTDVNWKLNLAKKAYFNGSEDMWEAIFDNLLSNFIRYAKSEIKITIRGGKITLYNDGDNIDEGIISDIFSPYTKGINGQFGLGLSIVQKTVKLFGYEIIVKNEKRGVSFIIK